MNKTMVMMILGLGLSVFGCGNQQDQSMSGQQGGQPAAAVSQVQAVMPETPPEPQNTAVSQVPAAVQELPGAADQIQQDLKQKAAEMTKKVQALLTQAQEYLDEGKLDEAIAAAQNVLKIDPQNLDAQKIIDSAKAKLKALAEQKMGDVQSGLMNTMKNLGTSAE